MRLAALEQSGEQAAEMAVDILEGREQARSSLAVQAADRAAQAVNGEPELLALGLAGQPAFLKLVELALGDQIDRADPLALLHLPLERGGFEGHLLDQAFVETDPLGEQRRRTFELLAG